MTKLTTKTRKSLFAKDFALPGRRYPIEDKAHAANAKARATQEFEAGKLSADDRAKIDVKADAVLGRKDRCVCLGRWPWTPCARATSTVDSPGTSQNKKVLKRSGFKTLNYLAPRPGLEPGTCGLTVRRSTD